MIKLLLKKMTKLLKFIIFFNNIFRKLLRVKA